MRKHLLGSGDIRYGSQKPKPAGAGQPGSLGSGAQGQCETSGSESEVALLIPLPTESWSQCRWHRSLEGGLPGTAPLPPPSEPALRGPAALDPQFISRCQEFPGAQRFLPIQPRSPERQRQV